MCHFLLVRRGAWPLSHLTNIYYAECCLHSCCNTIPSLPFNRQAYENCAVLEARICYNVARLMYLNSERYQFHTEEKEDSSYICNVIIVKYDCFACRKKAERSKKFFLDLQAKEHMATMINPKPCGHLCCCIIKGCEQVRRTFPINPKQ